MHVPPPPLPCMVMPLSDRTLASTLYIFVFCLKYNLLCIYAFLFIPTDFDELPSSSKKVSLTIPEEKKTCESCIHMRCSMTDAENSLCEADRLWIVGKKLYDETVIDKLICKKESAMAEFYFLVFEKLDTDSLVKLCDKIRKASQVFRFMYFTINDIRHRYSPEEELCIY